MARRTGETTGDRVRAGAVLATAFAQVVAGGLGGSGATGRSVGTVAQELSSPIQPAPAAFSIWGLIYLGVLVLAVRQVLPGEPAREVHRETGWWLVAAAVLNAGWILSFSAGAVLLAEVVIVALLVALAVVLARLAQRPAVGWADRLALHAPVALYAGWVSVATVVGTAATGVDLGLPGSGGVAATLAVVMILVTAVIAAGVVGVGPAVVAYAAAVVWALGWVVAAGYGVAVSLAAVVAIVVVLAAVVRRVARADGRGPARRGPVRAGRWAVAVG